MSDKLTDFEISVLHAFCEKNDLTDFSIRDQLQALCVRSRKYTGVGVYVDFENSHTRTPAMTFVISGVNAISAEGSADIGFLLFIRDGLIELLEGFSYVGDWPDDLSTYQVIVE